MYCKYCGSANDDNASVCQNCHSPLTAPQQNPNQAPYAPPQGQNQFAPPPYAVGNSTIPRTPYRTVSDIARTVLSSKGFLVAVILMTVALVAEIVMAATFKINPDFFVDFINQMDPSAGASLPSEFYQMNQMIDAMRPLMIVISLISSIPAIVILTGLWKLRAAGTKRDGEVMSTSGLTILKVINIIYIVFIAFVLVLLLAAAIIFMVASNNLSIPLGNGEEFPVQVVGMVFLVYFILFAIIFGAIIVLYAFIIKSINSIRKSIETNTHSVKYVTFIGVICYIIGINGALSLLSLLSFIAMPILPAISMLCIFAASGCEAVAYILFGVNAFKYKSLMNQQLHPTPVYPTMPPMDPPTYPTNPPVPPTTPSQN